MTKPKPKCLGCGGRTGKVKKGSHPLCPECRATPTIVNAVKDRMQVERWKQRIEDEAEAETASLPRQDSYIPLTGEALVLRLQRGEDIW